LWRCLAAFKAHDETIYAYYLALGEFQLLCKEQSPALQEAADRLLKLHDKIAGPILMHYHKGLTVMLENAEKVRAALYELGATDEDKASSEGNIRLVTGLTEREYRKGMKLLSWLNAVRTKEHVGTWLIL